MHRYNAYERDARLEYMDKSAVNAFFLFLHQSSHATNCRNKPTLNQPLFIHVNIFRQAKITVAIGAEIHVKRHTIRDKTFTCPLYIYTNSRKQYIEKPSTVNIFFAKSITPPKKSAFGIYIGTNNNNLEFVCDLSSLNVKCERSKIRNLVFHLLGFYGIKWCYKPISMHTTYCVLFLLLVGMKLMCARMKILRYSDRYTRQRIRLEFGGTAEFYCELTSAELSRGFNSANLSLSMFLAQYEGVQYGRYDPDTHIYGEASVQLIDTTTQVSARNLLYFRMEFNHSSAHRLWMTRRYWCASNVCQLWARSWNVYSMIR